MSFRSRLITSAYIEGEFVVVSPFIYQFHLKSFWHTITVPKGFITDFASIPWLVQALPGFDVNGDSRFAAVVHDYLYCMQGMVSTIKCGYLGDFGRLEPAQFSRADCDEIFKQALRDTGRDVFTRDIVKGSYSGLQADLFYAGVRAGGWQYWNKRKDGPRPDDFAPIEYMRSLEILACYP
jgi:hypothetical protein